MPQKEAVRIHPSPEEVAAWIQGLGKKPHRWMYIESEVEFDASGARKSCMINQGYYRGVTPKNKIRLYTASNALMGTEARTTLVDARKIFSIK